MHTHTILHIARHVSHTSPRLRHAAAWLLCLALLCGSCSKSDDADTYPSLITDFVMATGDGEGNLRTILTDDGRHLNVGNSVTGMPANATVRVMCSYELLTANSVQIYSIEAVHILRLLPEGMAVRHSPIAVAGVWQSGGFINMHLTPKTGGGVQNWAVVADSVTGNAAGGTTHHLSLYHDQAADNEAYTGHLYTSISPDSIAADFGPADSIRLSIATYTGLQTWTFPAR